MIGSRWLNWYPPEEKGSYTARPDPPKPPEHSFEGFAGSTSEQRPSCCPEYQDYDPTQWSEDFDSWRVKNCIHRGGRDDWGGVGALSGDFEAWCLLRCSVPCSRSTFAWLLNNAGLHEELGMVANLVLRMDLEAVLA